MKSLSWKAALIVMIAVMCFAVGQETVKPNKRGKCPKGYVPMKTEDGKRTLCYEVEDANPSDQSWKEMTQKGTGLTGICAGCGHGSVNGGSTTITADADDGAVTLNIAASGFNFKESDAKVVDAKLENGQLIITKYLSYYPSAVPAVACFPSPCDYTVRKVWKEVYGVKDGKVALVDSIEGTVVPAKHIEEHFTFPR